MPVCTEPGRRYPKRQRTSVVYNEPAGNHDGLDDVDDTAAAVTNCGAAIIDEGGSSESDEDWTQKPKRKKRNKKPKAKRPKVKKPQPFPFMRLPAELRENVYDLVVGQPDGVVPIEPSHLNAPRLRRTLEDSYKPVSGGWPNFAHRRHFRNLGLLRVCKAIYAEAAVVLYTKQRFAFSRLSALQTFLLLLRPETLDRIIHVELDVGEGEWTFMPGVASQLLQLHYLQTLKISGLGYSTSSRNFTKYLKATDRPESSWEVTMESYDRLRGIKFARDLYPFFYPFFNAVIRAESSVAKGDSVESQDAESTLGMPTPSLSDDSHPTSMHGPDNRTNEKEESRYKPLIGINALGRALEVDHNGISTPNWYHRFLKSEPLNQFELRPVTDERRATRREAFKEELLALMDKDSF